MVFTLARPVEVHHGSEDGVDPSITLTSGATAGNLLVVALGHRRIDAAAIPVVTGNGASGLTREYAVTDNTGGNKGVALFWKIAAGGETTFVVTRDQQWRWIAVAEFELPSGASGVSWHDHATAVANTAASSLTVGVPDPSSSNSLAWVSSFARGNSGAISFDSGFAGATRDAELAVSWRDDAQSVSGNNVTVTYDADYVAIMGSGVWVAAGLDVATPLDTPTGFTFTAHGSLRQLNGAWDAVPNAATYEAQVDQETSPGTWTNLTTYLGAATSFQLTDADGVDWSTTYRSRVRAHPAE